MASHGSLSEFFTWLLNIKKISVEDSMDNGSSVRAVLVGKSIQTREPDPRCIGMVFKKNGENIATRVGAKVLSNRA